METKQLVTGLIMTIIGLVIVVNLFIPAMSSATEGYTWDNSSIGRYSLSTEEETTLAPDVANNRLLSNGQVVDVTNSGDWSIILVEGEFCARYLGVVDGTIRIQALRYDAETGTFGVNNTNGLNGYQCESITVKAGSITIQDSNKGEVKFTFDKEVYVASPSGKYVMTNGIGEIYLSSSTEILAQGLSGNYFVQISGDINNLAIQAYHRITGAEVEGKIVKVDYTNINVDLVALSSIEVEITDGDTTLPATYNRVIVPAEVHYDLNGSAVNSIITLLPLFVIVGLVLGAVGMFISRREY